MCSSDLFIHSRPNRRNFHSRFHALRLWRFAAIRGRRFTGRGRFSGPRAMIRVAILILDLLAAKPFAAQILAVQIDDQTVRIRQHERVE